LILGHNYACFGFVASIITYTHKYFVIFLFIFFFSSLSSRLLLPASELGLQRAFGDN